MDTRARLIELIRKQKLMPTVIIDCSEPEFLRHTVQEMIQILICPQHSFPSDSCLICQRFKKNLLPNIFNLKSDYQPIKKEALKTYIRELSLFALEKSATKVFVIDLVEDLTNSAANTLLKFLEEPPKNTFIFLLTNNYWDTLATIRSRCPRYHIEVPKSLSEPSRLEKIIKNKSDKDFLNLSWEWSKLPKKELIEDLKLAYQNLIVPFYPQLVVATLNLLNDLNNLAIDNLAIANYLIDLETIIRN